MPSTLTRRAALASGLCLPLALAACGKAGGAEAMRIGQGAVSLSFLPIWAARAFDTFPAAGVALEWASISGGDPATLAALDAGELDLAAVGNDTCLDAIGKGQPFVLVHALMAKMTFVVTASPALLKRTGVAPSDPLAARIGALKDAVIGVNAVGGSQDRAVRWIAAEGGLDPKSLKIAAIGGPAALQAALEHGRIDAFMLSPPEPEVAVDRGYGVRLIEPPVEFPALKSLPNLVLAAKADPDPARADRICRALAGLNAASAKVLAAPDAAADLIGAKYFPRIPRTVLREGLRSMLDGIEGRGRFTPERLAALGAFAMGSGAPIPAGDAWWTNRFNGG